MVRRFFWRMIYHLSVVGACVSMLIFASPAEAPADRRTKQSNKARSIAAIQEIGFNQHLERFNLCYGIRLDFDSVSESRRRSCKAIVLHDLRRELSAPGTYFSRPVRFMCQSTGLGTTRFFDSEGVQVFRLKPNREHEMIETAVQNHLHRSDEPARWLEAKRACDFHLECQKRLNWSDLSFKVINRCLFQAGAEGRRMIWDSFRSVVFRSSTKQSLMNRYMGAPLINPDNNNQI